MFALLGFVAGKIGTIVVLLSQKIELPLGKVLSMVDPDPPTPIPQDQSLCCNGGG